MMFTSRNPKWRRLAKKKALGVLALMLLDGEEKACIKRKNRLVWVRGWIARRQGMGAFHRIVRELATEDPSSFMEYLRMDEDYFNHVVSLVSLLIKKEDTGMREAISPAETIALTLRFLAIFLRETYHRRKLGQQLSVIVRENRAGPKDRGRLFTFIFSQYKTYPKRSTTMIFAEVGIRFSSRYHHIMILASQAVQNGRNFRQL